MSSISARIQTEKVILLTNISVSKTNFFRGHGS